MKIEINNKYGKRLKTSKTIVEEDIEVVPVLQELTITENGIYPVGEGYAGIGEVVVNAAGVIDVSTETEMTELLSTGKVGGIYKYTGTDGTYENGELYQLNENEVDDSLAGTWVFNDVLNKLGIDTFIATMEYSFTGGLGGVLRHVVGRFLYYNGDVAYRYETGDWTNNDYKIITISTLYSDLVVQAISKEQFFSWLQTNATKTASLIQKSFTKLILESSLEEITITENGEYLPTGDGYSKVTVNVAGEVIEEYDGSVRDEITPQLTASGGEVLTDANGTIIMLKEEI